MKDLPYNIKEIGRNFSHIRLLIATEYSTY